MRINKVKAEERRQLVTNMVKENPNVTLDVLQKALVERDGMKMGINTLVALRRQILVDLASLAIPMTENTTQETSTDSSENTDNTTEQLPVAV